MDPDRVRSQLDRILASAAFAGAERASTFLRFVVLCALSGRAGEIKESVIAVEVLGRIPSFVSKPGACAIAWILIIAARVQPTRLSSQCRRAATFPCSRSVRSPRSH